MCQPVARSVNLFLWLELLRFSKTQTLCSEFVAVKIAHIGGVEVQSVMRPEARGAFGRAASGKRCLKKSSTSFQERALNPTKVPFSEVALFWSKGSPTQTAS